tara:strand:+ start:2349 stop:2642 length:294 start_codon:yes stop_codon:yes gene_type:complete
MFEDIMFGYVMPLMTIIGSVVTVIILMALIGSFMDGPSTTVTTLRPTTLKSDATYLELYDADMLDFPFYAENGDTHWHNGRRYIKGFRGWSLINGAR